MEHIAEKKFIIENLDLENTSIEEIVSQRENYFLDTDDLNVFYSYPYFSRGDFDFQFRLFVEQDSLILEDVKCNDTAEDDLQSIIVNNELARVGIKEGLELIKNGCDLKSGNKIEINGDILKYDFDGLSEDEIREVLINNKNIVLLELYKNFY